MLCEARGFHSDHRQRGPHWRAALAAAVEQFGSKARAVRVAAAFEVSAADCVGQRFAIAAALGGHVFAAARVGHSAPAAAGHVVDWHRLMDADRCSSKKQNPPAAAFARLLLSTVGVVRWRFVRGERVFHS